MKSILATTNTATQAISAGGTADLLGNITRRCGQGITATTTAINLFNVGYYTIDVEAVLAGTEGNAIIDVLQDGNVIGSGTVSIGTAATEIHTLGIIANARVFCGQNSSITIVVNSASTSTPTISRLAVRVVKL